MYSKNCFPIKATLFFKPFQLIDSDRELKKILTFLCECFFNRSVFFHFPVKKTKCAEYALLAFNNKTAAELFFKETDNNKEIAINQEDRKMLQRDNMLVYFRKWPLFY